MLPLPPAPLLGGPLLLFGAAINGGGLGRAVVVATGVVVTECWADTMTVPPEAVLVAGTMTERVCGVVVVVMVEEEEAVARGLGATGALARWVETTAAALTAVGASEDVVGVPSFSGRDCSMPVTEYFHTQLKVVFY